MGFYEKKLKVCPECQREMDYYEKACILCGHEFDVEYNDPRAPYIGENVGDYLYKFERLERKNTKIGWSWCAFIFGPTWMFYRKMYQMGLIFLIVPLIADCFSYLAYLTNDTVILIASVVDLIVTLALWIAGGLFSDYWYMKKMDGLVREGASLEGEAQVAFAQDKGGTSVKMVFVYFGLCVISGFILMPLESLAM